ncbi:MAG: IS66 family insertion sequence element accessory protein TnpB [Acetobacteraceae bacterium]
MSGWRAASPTCKGFDGLASLAQHQLGKDAFSGQLFAFRGRRGSRAT